MIVRKVALSLLLIAALLRPEVNLFAAEMGKIVQPSSLCRAEERAIFTCVAAGSAKLVSSCGSKLVDHRRGNLQYPLRHTRRHRAAISPGTRQYTTCLSLRPLFPRPNKSRRNQLRQPLFDYYDADGKRSPLPVSVSASMAQKDGKQSCDANLDRQASSDPWKPASVATMPTYVRDDSGSLSNVRSALWHGSIYASLGF